MSNTDEFINNFNEKVKILKEQIENRLKSESNFKSKVFNSLTGIKSTLQELQKKKGELKSLFDKASEVNTERENKIKELETEVNNLKNSLYEITRERDNIKAQLDDVNNQLKKNVESSANEKAELEKQKEELQSELDRINSEKAQTDEQINNLNQSINTLSADNEKLKQAMTNALASLEESLNKLNTEELKPEDVETAYQEILNIIADISSVIGGTEQTIVLSQPSTNEIVNQSDVFTDNTDVSEYFDELPVGTTYAGLVNMLENKVNQIRRTNPNAASKYINALNSLQSIKGQPRSNVDLKKIMYGITIKNNGIMGGNRTKKIRKINKTKKARKQKGGFTYSSSSRRVSPETRRLSVPLRRYKKYISKKNTYKKHK